MFLSRRSNSQHVVQPGRSIVYSIFLRCSISIGVTNGSHSRFIHGDTVRPSRIAVLGGGISGLSAAYFASCRYPYASITLFEESARLGGVIESIPVHLESGNTLICETGARTLRPNNPRALATFELIHNLGLTSSLLTVAKSSSIHGKRYILSPDGRLVPIPWGYSAQRLTHLPSILWKVCTEPMLTGIISGFMHDILFARRPDVLHDESIAEFVRRRWGGVVADNLVSAAVHGLCAGDIDSLSARSIVPICILWDMEKAAEERRKKKGEGITAGAGGVLAELIRLARGRIDKSSETTCGMATLNRYHGNWLQALRDSAVGGLQSTLRDASVFSFQRGIGQLPAALEESLRQKENVELKLGANVTGIEKSKGGIEITTGPTSQLQHFTHAISTLPLNQLLLCAKKWSTWPFLPETCVTVLSVNLCYTAHDLNHPYRGFGYLIPRSVPLSINPHQALGVVFDTDAMPGQDCGPASTVGTKISVLFGGHWWNERKGDEYPDQQQALYMAKDVLRSHLGITHEPTRSIVALRREAIPQFSVGHRGRMQDLHNNLLWGFEGRLRVAGKSFLGIGIHDCIFSAKNVVEDLATVGLSGLEVLGD